MIVYIFSFHTYSIMIEYQISNSWLIFQTNYDYGFGLW